MKLLPLFILGGGFYLFTKNKSGIKSNIKSESIISKIGSKEIGYELINCNKLIIHDQNKAYSHAFNQGYNLYIQDVKAALDDNIETKSIGLPGLYNIEKNLIGLCFDSENIKLLSKKNALFLFNLVKALYAGYAHLDPLSSDNDILKMNLSHYINNMISLNGYDTSDFKIENLEVIY